VEAAAAVASQDGDHEAGIRQILALLYSKPRAAIMPNDNPIKWMPIQDLHQEPGAHELATSPSMEPYLNFAAALIQGNDPEPELEAIRQLPLEERYVWRVASELKWAFADLDDLSVTADKDTLTPEDFARVMDLLKLRPMQMALFLKALVGTEQMLLMMVQAVRVAQQNG
jgi:hypothetical protein